MKTTKTQLRLNRLHDLGFDESYIIRGGMIRVKCSQCQAATINGIAAHEHGCPNYVHECRGCNELVSANVRYCQDCQ